MAGATGFDPCLHCSAEWLATQHEPAGKTSRRSFLKAAGFGAGALAVPGLARVALAAERHPNILLIMADDMGFSDLACYGSEIATPNLDRLAAGGIRFTRFYSCARCCPTRAALLTGLYPHQAGMGGMVSRGKPKPGPYQGYLSDECVTIAEVLRDAGYRTCMSGKWHVGEDRPHWPTDRGFERYFGLISGAANYFDIRKGKRQGIVRRFARDDKAYAPPTDGFYMTDAITDHAVGFLQTRPPIQLHTSDRPFFLYVAYTAPHWPLHALPEDIERYRGRYLEGWDVLRAERYERMVRLGIIDGRWRMSPRDPAAVAWSGVKDKGLMDLKMAVYAAQIDRMDQGIGRIVGKLKATGKERDTLVMFLSDNGACHESGPLGFDLRKNGLPPGGVDSYMSYGRSWSNAGNTPFRLHKHWVHEGGIASPLIARWPAGIRARGKIVRDTGHVIDIMATCCDVAGARYPESRDGRKLKPLEGKSLLPVLKGGTRDGHEAIYWEHMGNRAVRKGNWKLVSTSKGRWELYDIEADRTELDDLAAKRPGIVEELLGLYKSWAARCGVRERPKKRGR